jgi:deoxycytidine triphosphate deaminase
MSVLSNIQIREGIQDGHVICHPLIQKNIRGSSIDMTLGEWYYLCERRDKGSMGDVFSALFSDNMSSLARLGIYNPFDQQDVDAYFGGAVKAEPLSDQVELVGIPKDHPVIVIPPRSRILAHTHEFIGIHPPGTSEMRARSSWGRNGIAVCLCAGWGDPGYINRWTMEIHNMNDEAVPIPIGERVAQLVFHETGEVAGHYGEGGKYQGHTDIEATVAAWTPEAMLPRSYEDERRLPLPV